MIFLVFLHFNLVNLSANGYLNLLGAVRKLRLYRKLNFLTPNPTLTVNFHKKNKIVARVGGAFVRRHL